MQAARSVLILALLGAAVTPDAAANEVRYYEQNGVTYRETRQVVQRPVYQTEMRPTTQTVYRQEQSTETRETSRTWWSPVTEHGCEAVWMGRWNPFIQPYLVYRPTTRTRWESRTETVQAPVTVTRWVPQTQTTEKAVTVQRMVPEEIVSRVAIGSSGVSTVTSPSLSSSGQYGSTGALAPVPLPALTATSVRPLGGVARLDSDPPRRGVTTAWRPSTPATR